MNSFCSRRFSVDLVISCPLKTHLHPQPGQVQANGFSPVCRLRWAFRWLLLVYILAQPGKVHLCILIRSATELFWNLWPPTTSPAPWPSPAPFSPRPMGLAAMGTGAMRTNFEDELLRLAWGIIWGTKAKVWPWMLTRSWVILMSEAGCGVDGAVLGFGSGLTWTGWSCRITGMPGLSITTTFPDASSFLRTLWGFVEVASEDCALLCSESAVTTSLETGTVWSKLWAHVSDASPWLLAPLTSPSPDSSLKATTSMFSSKNSSISSSVGWNSSPAWSSRSPGKTGNSKHSSLAARSRRDSHDRPMGRTGGTMGDMAVEEFWLKVDWAWRKSKRPSWLSPLELLPQLEPRTWDSGLEQERGLDESLRLSSENGDGSIWYAPSSVTISDGLWAGGKVYEKKVSSPSSKWSTIPGYCLSGAWMIQGFLRL